MKYAVELLNITKRFPGIVANDDITIRIEKGKVHALLGENGAGKSTLMSILFGLYSLDEGSIRINEKEVRITNPNDANSLGIGMVHQHFKLVHDFTVLENIILGIETTKNGFLDMATAKEKVVMLSKRYGLSVNPDSLISDITVGMQQRVEILKMLYRENDILIFDEPTAVLLPQEVDELIKIIHGLAAEDKTVIFISHKLEEIKRVADQCTILRRGKVAGTVVVATTSKEQMAEMMVGRKVLLNVEKGQGYKGEEKTVLELRDITVKDKISGKLRVDHVSFSIKAGEIVSIAGVDGNGQTQLVEAITGMCPSSGELFLCGENVTSKNIRYRNTHGLSHIPEDRQRYGLVMEFSISENTVLQEYFDDRFQQNGFIKNNAINKHADMLINKYDVRAGQGRDTSAESLSGGNQQKLILARELERGHELVIAFQPTRGLDVGATEQVQTQLVSQRNEGKAVLLLSLELEEVMSLSDRILVIHDGKIVGADLIPSEIDMKELGLYMAGVKAVAKMNKLNKNKIRKSSNLPAALVACLFGLIVGFLVLLATNPANSIKGFLALLTGPISGEVAGLGNVIKYAGIFILCGLSVGFAGKTGVFNIGGSGQFLVGGSVAVFLAITLDGLPPALHCFLPLLAGALAGAVWGSLIGVLKAWFNISEIVVGILLNYIGLYLVNMFVLESFYNPLANRSKPVPSTALVPTLGLDKIFPSTGADASIFIAIILAVVIYIILNKTTFGYEVRTCGYNKDAGTYSGINAKRNIIYSMAIAGALPGLAGALYYFSSSYNYITVADSIPGQPMVGIAASLIAMGNPIGIIFSSLFVAYITVSGLSMQLFGYAPEIVDVVTSAIIYSCAFVSLINKSSIKFLKKITRLKQGKQ